MNLEDIGFLDFKKFFKKDFKVNIITPNNSFKMNCLQVG